MNREIHDINAMRDMILGNVLTAVQNKYPIENTRYRLELTNLKYNRDKPPSIAEQKEAIMNNKSLTRQLQGTWKMVDKESGKVVDQKSTIVAHVPEVTNRGTFVHEGGEYTIANQLRLRAGVYARKKASGELEAHFNVIPGTGRAFRVHMEPETGVFKMQIGQSHLPLYPLLRGMGVPDDQLKKTWGKDLFDANRSKDDPRVMDKAYERLVRKPVEGESKLDGINRTFQEMSLDPDIVQHNLGGWMGEDTQDN